MALKGRSSIYDARLPADLKMPPAAEARDAVRMRRRDEATVAASTTALLPDAIV